MSETNNSGEHIRYAQLRKVCNKALDESTRVITDDNIRSCYPSLANASDNGETIHNITSQLISSWRQNALKEFSAIFNERDLETKLNELDEMIHDAKIRKEKNEGKQPSIDQLTPGDIVSSHLIPLKEAKLKTLGDQLEKLRLNNTTLLQELNDLTNEATNIKNLITDKLLVIEKFNNAAEENELQPKLQSLIEMVANEERDSLRGIAE